jgi:hypothetical protein
MIHAAMYIPHAFTLAGRNAYNEPQRLAETQLTQFHNPSYRTELSAHPSVLATP